MSLFSRRIRTSVATIGVLALTSGALAACTSGATLSGSTDASNGPGGGSVLRIGMAGDPGNLDPTLSSTLSAIQMYPAFCEALYGEYADGVRPQLAAAMPHLSEDRRSVQISLRPGAKFADGTPVDAEAVRFSLDRHKTLPGSQRGNELDAVSQVTVIDPATIRLDLKYPLAEGVLLTNLAARAGTIVSPKAATELGPQGFNQAPVCSGPFKFASRVAQNNVTLVKDPNYYGADKVQLDKVEYRIIADPAVRLTNLRSGDLDIVERISPTDLATVNADKNLAVKTLPSLGHINLIVNIGNRDGADKQPIQRTDPLAANPDIRKALAMSIDRAALNKIVYAGQYAPTCGFVQPGTAYASEATDVCPGFDPAGAKRLLESTGVPLPFKVEIVMTQNPEFRRMGELIQQMAANAGFEVTLNMQESTSAAQTAQSGKFQIYFNSFLGWTDPDMNVSRFFYSSAGTNAGKFVHPDLDRLLKEARSEADLARRKELYGQIHQIITADTASVYLLRPTNIVAYNAKLSDLDFHSLGTVVPTRIARR